MNENPKDLLASLSEKFDDSLVQMKPAYSGGQPMPYVSQGLVTKRLNAKAPDWSSRILGREMITMPILRYDRDAKKKIMKDVTWVEMTLELTIPGLGTRQEVGVAEMVNDYGTAAKAAASDALKRAAMRFGVALYMWEQKEEQEGEDNAPNPLTEAQERVIAEARDMAEQATPYPAIILHLRQLQADATPDQWTAIRRQFLEIRRRYYPETLQQQEA